MSKSARPDDDVVTIGDLRQVYRLLLRVEERLCLMHSKLYEIDCNVREDRKRLDAIIAALAVDDSQWHPKQ